MLLLHAMTATRFRGLTLCLPCLGLWGCIAVENSRLELGNDLLLPAVAPADATPPPPPASDPTTLTSLTRDNWTPTEFRVPRDGVETAPTYRPLFTYPTETARQRGEFPTVLTALEGAGDETNNRQLRGILGSHGRAVVDAAILLPRMIAVRSPWYSMESPRVDYERWPSGPTAPTSPAVPVEASAPESP